MESVGIHDAELEAIITKIIKEEGDKPSALLNIVSKMPNEREVNCSDKWSSKH